MATTPLPWTLQALVGALLALPGCITMDGPCQLRIERSASSASSSLQCEAGGSASLLAPAHTIEATKELPHDPAINPAR